MINKIIYIEKIIIKEKIIRIIENKCKKQKVKK